ncbi:peptidase S41 [Bacteroidales bacterium]|nr:peptidase S41 [Bacteroidales bacterium]
MHRYKLIFIYIATLSLLWSCVEVELYDNSPHGNFEAAWKMLDEKYCFFQYKGVDWDAVYDDYSERMYPEMGEQELFSHLNNMLRELKDGHVNLYSPFNTGGYNDWVQKYASNFNRSLVEKYLGQNIQEDLGLQYKLLASGVGYVYCGNFVEFVGEKKLNQMLLAFSSTKGLIIDVRDNGGGSISNSKILASRFTEREVLISYIQHKQGKGRNDFSKPYPIYLKPSSQIRYTKPVIVLTNRACYSACNEFVTAMRELPHATIMGSRTGGGSGLPATSELPNGWFVRYSASPILAADKQQIEDGIEPDISVDLLDADIKKGKDSLIEAAIALIQK